MITPPHALSVTEAGARLRDGTLTAAALTEHALSRIETMDGDIHAFVTVTAARARADAARADQELAAGLDRGAMHGIPYALKDVVDTAGIRTTAQSRLRLHHVPDTDATVAARLAAAGGVLLGKLATYEFATVGPDDGLPFPPARNPRDLARIPGGSSSGCAAAVAAGFARVAIGTDTGGSVRAPACYCGVVGLKPTYNLVPCDGVFPLSPSLDHVGVLAASVADAAAAFSVVADRAAPVDWAGLGGFRIGYARGFHAGEAAADIAAAFDAAADGFGRLGAEIVEVALPDPKTFEDCGTIILQAEAFAIHRNWLAERGDAYGRLAYQNLVSGAALTAADLALAHRARERLVGETLAAFGQCDVLLVAGALTTAPRFDWFDGITPRWTAMRTFAFNVTGLPAMAVPIGVARDGLPLGMQIVGRPFDEATVLRAGAAWEARPAGDHSRVAPTI